MSAPAVKGMGRSYSAEAAIAAYRIVKFGAADGGVLIAAASTDKLVGINGRIAAAAAGDRIDIERSGIALVEYGGTVAAGDLLTSDASGRAIAAAPGAGVNAYVIGQAEVAGVVGDIGSCLVAPGRIQG
ncbi:MAG: DUF2190 family protein [Piscinibacter sp.]|uniref:capsid cement protein n=1 Tax=Piscinibacter sp. TaxID=1903157 RepID=UPI00258B0123|nr:capsid cement protein [Piscinibacter sp.]MCW5666485.1 DUF2190 family protein [Piscinibacter sp.]